MELTISTSFCFLQRYANNSCMKHSNMDATDQFKRFSLFWEKLIQSLVTTNPYQKKERNKERKTQEKQRRDKGWKESVNRKQNKRKMKKAREKRKKLSALPNHYHIEKHDSEMSEWNMQATLNTEHFRFPRAAWTNICACTLSLSLSLSL